jgi:hypothetical protein
VTDQKTTCTAKRADGSNPSPPYYANNYLILLLYYRDLGCMP